MNKADFIKKFSKIEDTFEDEFRSEFNSPELLWIALKEQLILTISRKCSCPKESDDFYDEYGNLVGWGCLECGFIGE